MTEFILYVFVSIDLVLAIILTHWSLKTIVAKYALIAYWAVSAIFFFISAIPLLGRHNTLGAVIGTLVAIFFVVATYATTKWKMGELYPQPREWFKK